MRKTYPSDVSRKQFEKIRPMLESARKQTKPRELDLYDVFCAVLYLLKSGCQCSQVICQNVAQSMPTSPFGKNNELTTLASYNRVSLRRS